MESWSTASEPPAAAAAPRRSLRLLRALCSLRAARSAFAVTAAALAASSASSSCIIVLARSSCSPVMSGTGASVRGRVARPRRWARSNLRAATCPLICA
eukprot:scaffold3418_cov124-Isochrysis_galbana.AAC.7